MAERMASQKQELGISVAAAKDLGMMCRSTVLLLGHFITVLRRNYFVILHHLTFIGLLSALELNIRLSSSKLCSCLVGFARQ